MLSLGTTAALASFLHVLPVFISLSSRRNESDTPLGPPGCGCETMIANPGETPCTVSKHGGRHRGHVRPCSIAFLPEVPAIQCEHGWVSGPQDRVVFPGLSKKSNGSTSYHPCKEKNNLFLFFGTRLNSFALKHHPLQCSKLNLSIGQVKKIKCEAFIEDSSKGLPSLRSPRPSLTPQVCGTKRPTGLEDKHDVRQAIYNIMW